MRRMTFMATAALVVAAVVSVGFGGPGAAQELPPGGTFIDDNGNVHEGYIEAVAAEGITEGCDSSGTRFCPSDPVTRAQMATFLARALELTDTAYPDAFSDDDGSVHEPWINAMAAMSITSGCDASNPDLYCPDVPVNRGQMASFLVRAIDGIDAATTNAFADDDGLVHETNIDGLAMAGVTQGCSTADPTRYCPDDPVRRDQMATFLGRALGLTPIVPPPPVGFACTEVIGFSQTNQWYEPLGGAFETIVADDAWQLRWRSSSYIQLIAQADWEAWAESPKSPCATSVVDRAVLTISGLAGNDVDRWAADISDAVVQIRSQHPTVRQILLQPVVGGPNHGLCFHNGQQIRASYQHPFIDEAIAQVAAAEAGVDIGFSPEVPDCAGFSDSIGHLSDGYGSIVGTTVGEYYAGG